MADGQIYKARTIQSEVRVAVALDYPIFSGSFSDHFLAGDWTKWFQDTPSWIALDFAATVLRSRDATNGISSAVMQSQHNQAFPLSRDTDWTFKCRIRFDPVTGFGSGLRLCGRSFRDAEAVFTVWCDSANHLVVTCPSGYSVNN